MKVAMAPSEIVQQFLDVAPEEMASSCSEVDVWMGNYIDRFPEDHPFSGMEPQPDCWLGCGMAYPHDDRGVTKTHLFVSLTLFGAHHLGDAKCYGYTFGSMATPGALFVIDPLVVHWLMPATTWAFNSSVKPAWGAVQWEIPRKGFTNSMRRLVKLLKGEWVTRDPRYVKLVPKSHRNYEWKTKCKEDSYSVYTPDEFKKVEVRINNKEVL